MNDEVLSVKLSETLGFDSSKLVEQMSHWAQRPAMDRLWDILDASDENYIVNIFIYIILPLTSKNLALCRKKSSISGICAHWDICYTHLKRPNPKVADDLTESSFPIVLWGSFNNLK